MPLSPTAQKVQDILAAHGFDCKVIEHAESTRTAQEAADRAGCSLGQITKSLIFKGNRSGKPILVLTSGANRVNEKSISALRRRAHRPRAMRISSAASRALRSAASHPWAMPRPWIPTSMKT